jgi:hypothetical protein
MRGLKKLGNVGSRLGGHINKGDGLFTNDLPLLLHCLHELVWVGLCLRERLLVARLDEEMFVHLRWVVLLHLVLEMIEQQHLWLV